MTQLSLGGLGGIVLAPDALDEQRSAWCSPLAITKAVTESSPFDLDPFTNPRSTLQATHTCMLERGDDGFGLTQRHVPGSFYVNPDGCANFPDGCGVCGQHVADETWKVWIQPDYEFVIEAIAHYLHTRFVALLRLDTSTKWFETLWRTCQVIMVPKRDRLEFVPPPGVKASSNPFPHGVYYKHCEDVTNAIFALCYPWPTPQYPWADDPLELMSPIYFEGPE